MKVLCTKIPQAPTGDKLEASPWVTVNAEYLVVSVLAVPGRQVQIQLVADDGLSLAWFDSTNFMSVDGAVPEGWAVQLGEGGVLELAPAEWLTPGFWELYYDGDPSAVDSVESELLRLREERP